MRFVTHPDFASLIGTLFAARKEDWGKDRIFIG
jgi:hypothetical protein